jgi:hypothetical protein
MALSLLESLRKLIRQDTVKVGGSIGNMHGAVRVDLASTADSATQTWLGMTIPSRDLPTLPQFLATFAEDPSAMELEVASEGVLSLTLTPYSATLLRTVVNADRTLNFNLEITVPTTGGVAAVYVDGNLVRTIRGTAAAPVTLSSGQHTLYVLVVSPSITITAPKRLSFVGETDVPSAPQWESSTTGYLDQISGTSANILRWLADPEVGHYRVLRREPKLIANLAVPGDGEVLGVSALTTNDTFSITIDGDHAAEIPLQAVLLNGGESIGVVTGVQVDTGDTIITCRLPLGVAEPPTTGLLNQLLYIGTFTELSRVTRVANTAILEYVDGAVTKDVAYEYALQAAGLVDETILSPLSQIRYLVTGDFTAPGPIVFESGYPTVLNKNVTVRFTTPADLDYAGVNVYFRQRILNGANPYDATNVSGTTVTVTPTTLPTAAGGLAGYKLRFVNATYGAYTFEIASNTASAITLTETVPTEIQTVINAAQPVDLTIYKDTALRTDRGLPNRPDELNFEAQDYGQYYFATFDRSGNEQDFATAVTWDYDPTDDNFTSPPVLALRQLVASEQAYFFLSGTGTVSITTGGAATFSTSQTFGVGSQIRVSSTNYTITAGSGTSYTVTPNPGATITTQPFSYWADSVNYAVIEVWAYDPSLPTANQYDGVSVKYQRGNGTIESLPMDGATALGTPAYPNLVTSTAEAILDTPPTTRSRFILVNRNDEGINVWAENASGLTTDKTTFIADLDTTPEATLETTISTLTNTVQFVVVVDDDTKSFKWQVDEGTTYTVDTTTQKRISIDGATKTTGGALLYPELTLELGQLKQLKVRPYADNPPTTPYGGELIVRDLVRTPRSSVTFDNKDANGNYLVTQTKAIFSMAPAQTKTVTGRTGTLATVGNNQVLTDSGSPGWTVNQFQTGSTKFYYLLLFPTSAQGREAISVPIVSNTANTVTVTGLSQYVGLSPSSLNYEIHDGAVLFRQVIGGVAQGNFQPSTGTKVFSKTADFDLEFYATKTGCYPESPRRVTVDADDLPSLSGFQYTPLTISTVDYLQLGFGGYDDDATFWEVYEKKGGWPTTDAAQPSSTVVMDMSKIDRNFLRFSGSVDQSYYRRARASMTAGDVWYAVAVPKNSFGQVGYPSTAQFTVGGTVNAITDITLTPSVNNTYVNVTFSYTGSGTTNVSLSSVRSDDPNTTVTGSVQVSSTYQLPITEKVVASGGITRTWTVTATLTGGNTVTRSVTFQVEESTSTGSTLSLTGTASIYSMGLCSNADCTSLFSAPHQRLVTWALTVTGTGVVSNPATPYRINIDVAKEFTATNWYPLVVGLNAADRSYIDTTGCAYSDGTGGLTEYWHYRLTVTDQYGVDVSPAVTYTIARVTENNMRSCTGGIGGGGGNAF